MYQRLDERRIDILDSNRLSSRHMADEQFDFERSSRRIEAWISPHRGMDAASRGLGGLCLDHQHPMVEA